jgi:hypothetical protein
MDIFDELQGFTSVSYMPRTPVSSPVQWNQYKPPIFRDAKQVWDDCLFGDVEGSNTISFILKVWATEKGILQEDRIHWVSNSGVTYKSTWSTFLKWFFLQCQKIR